MVTQIKMCKFVIASPDVVRAWQSLFKRRLPALNPTWFRALSYTPRNDRKGVLENE